MVKYCVVPRCSTRQSKSTKLFCVPFTNKPRWKAWLTACPFLQQYKVTQLENIRICRLHFTSDHINDRNRLTPDAIPTLHLPDLHKNQQTDGNLFLENAPKLSVNLQQPLNPNSSSNSQQSTVEPDKLTSDQFPKMDGGNVMTVQASVYDQEKMDDADSLRIEHHESMILENAEHISSQFSTLKEQQTLHEQSLHLEPSVIIINPQQPLSPNSPPNPDSEHIPMAMPCITTAHSSQTSPVRISAKPKQGRVQLRSLTQQLRINPNEITPRKKKLRDNNLILKHKLRIMQSRFEKFKQRSEIHSPKTLAFLKKYSSLSKFGKLLINSQLRLTGIKPKGRRYTSEEKIFALSLFKLSPKCYAYLRKYLALPTKSNINKMLSHIPLRPGINDFIFQHLANVCTGKSILDKQCVLLFDEMAIHKNLFFNFYTGVIQGFEDLGHGECSSNVADKVLVFMLRGLFSPWKIPISFYFVRDGIKTFALKKIIKEIISAVHQSGFNIRATVSDQATTNVAAIKSLMSDTKADLLRNNSSEIDNIIYYKVENNKIYHIYDVPHLLKCFRNNFQKKNILIGEQRAQWKYLETLYKVDGFGGKARTTKLTDKHINPHSYDKMKVKLAAQIFSRQVATSLQMYMKSLLYLQEHRYGIPDNIDIESGLFTAEILLFVNDLFDSLNCFGHSGGKLQQALSINSEHFEFWNNAMKKLLSMRFDASDERESKPLSLKNFVHNIQTIKHLWVDLRAIDGVKFLSLRRLNQDPLENFFGQIRAQGGFNTNPDSSHFVSAFKTLLINNITTGKSLYANCATDDDKMLGTLDNLVHTKKFSSYVDDNSMCTQIANLNVIENCIPQENVLQTNSVSYIAGAICRCLFPKLPCANCKECKNALLSDKVESYHLLVESREYSSTQNKLYYASNNLSSLVWQCIYRIDKILPKICNVYIYPDLLNTLKQIDISWFTCIEHKESFFDAFWLYIIRMQVRQWCINFNRRINKTDTRPKGAEMENLIKTKVTMGLSYRSKRLRSD